MFSKVVQDFCVSWFVFIHDLSDFLWFKFNHYQFSPISRKLIISISCLMDCLLKTWNIFNNHNAHCPPKFYFQPRDLTTSSLYFYSKIFSSIETYFYVRIITMVMSYVDPSWKSTCNFVWNIQKKWIKSLK